MLQYPSIPSLSKCRGWESLVWLSLSMMGPISVSNGHQNESGISSVRELN